MIRKWCTEFQAIDVRTGTMVKWCGEYIEAPTAELAQEWCYKNAGYLKVIGELKSIIPINPSGEIEWDKEIDNDKIQDN